MRGRKIFWTDDKLEFIRANNFKMKVAELAAHFGVSEMAYWAQMTAWRKRGEVINGPKRVPLNTIVKRRRNGVLLDYIKTEKGYRRYDTGDAPIKPKTLPKPRVRKTQKSTITPSRSRKALKPEPKKFETRTQDISSMKKIYIKERRLTVYVPHGKSEEEIIAKYTKSRF